MRRSVNRPDARGPLAFVAGSGASACACACGAPGFVVAEVRSLSASFRAAPLRCGAAREGRARPHDTPDPRRGATREGREDERRSSSHEPRAPLRVCSPARRLEEAPMTHATHGRFIWYDHLARDPEAAIAFYSHVFGWTTKPIGQGYTTFAGGQGAMAGTVSMPERLRAMGVPAHWSSNVLVDDIDVSVAKVKE